VLRAKRGILRASSASVRSSDSVLGTALASSPRMQCQEIMKQRLRTVLPELSVNAAARLMKTEQIGFLPVCDDSGNLLGVVTDRDIVLRLCAEDLPADRTPVSTIMTQNPVCCSVEDTLDHAEELMLKHKTRRVLTLDSHGKLAGLITLADVAQYQEPYKTARWLRELTAHRFRVER
jgi:CBS domain-containing protein